MLANARIAMWEGLVGILLDEECYEAVHAAGTNDRVLIELEICEGKLLVGLTPDADGRCTVAAVDRQALPYLVRTSCHNFAEAVCEHLSRSMTTYLELSGSYRGLSGEVDLLPHLRPWPRIRPNKQYDHLAKMVEVYRERILSCAAAGDLWQIPPKDFMARCPKGFMEIWNSLPAGLTLRMEDGYVHRR